MCKVWGVVKLPLLFSGLLWVVRYVMAVCHFANLLSNIGFEIVVFKNVNILVESEYETPDSLETTYVDVQTIVLVAEGSDVSLGFGVFLEEYILGECSKMERYGDGRFACEVENIYSRRGMKMLVAPFKVDYFDGLSARHFKRFVGLSRKFEASYFCIVCQKKIRCCTL